MSITFELTWNTVVQVPWIAEGSTLIQNVPKLKVITLLTLNVQFIVYLCIMIEQSLKDVYAINRGMRQLYMYAIYTSYKNPNILPLINK